MQSVFDAILAPAPRQNLTRAEERRAMRSEAPLAPILPQPTFQIVSVSPDRFQAFKTHPRQRDTERHAAQAAIRHLSTPSVTQVHVVAASYKGDLYKVDGHTRSYLWSIGRLPRHQVLSVTIYRCDSFEQLIDLYDKFDNKGAVETASDSLSGLVRKREITLQSNFLRSYSFSSALHIVGSMTISGYDKADPDRVLNAYATELELLDKINQNKSWFISPIIALSLILLKKHPTEAVKFLTAYNSDSGIKMENSCDGVYALKYVKISNPLSGTSNNKRSYDIVARGISCFQTYVEKKMYSTSKNGSISVRSSDIGKFFGKRIS